MERSHSAPAFATARALAFSSTFHSLLGIGRRLNTAIQLAVAYLPLPASTSHKGEIRLGRLITCATVTREKASSIAA